MRRFIAGVVVGAALVLPFSARAVNGVADSREQLTERMDRMCKVVKSMQGAHPDAWRVACAGVFQPDPTTP